VEIPDFHVGADDLLAIELGDDADDSVHGGMRGPDVEQHVPGFHVPGSATARQRRR
jgi:hypothetical protein